MAVQMLFTIHNTLCLQATSVYLTENCPTLQCSASKQLDCIQNGNIIYHDENYMKEFFAFNLHMASALIPGSFQQFRLVEKDQIVR